MISISENLNAVKDKLDSNQKRKKNKQILHIYITFNTIDYAKIEFRKLTEKKRSFVIPFCFVKYKIIFINECKMRHISCVHHYEQTRPEQYNFFTNLFICMRGILMSLSFVHWPTIKNANVMKLTQWNWQLWWKMRHVINFV